MISLNNISKEYPGKILFKDVSLRIGDSERMAIVGPNGAGKSTLMKILTGEIESDSGELAQSRAKLRRIPAAGRRRAQWTRAAG